MKSVFAILLAAGLLLTCCSACGKQIQESAQATPTPTQPVSFDTGVAVTPAPTDAETMYRAVLDAYRDAQAQDFYSGRLGEVVQEDSDLNFELLQTAASYQAQGIVYQVLYAFHDLDGNGTSELLIAGTTAFQSQSETAPPDIYNVYAYDGSKPVMLASAGYRTHLALYQNGEFIVHGSGGAQYYHYSFCKIAANGCEKEIIDEVSVYYPDASAAPVYSHDFDQDNVMFAREFEVLMQSYADIGALTVDWNLLTA